MRRVAVWFTFIVVLGLPSGSLAHGDLQATSPEAGATVPNAPKNVTVTLTQAPTKGAEVRVQDGCRRSVPSAVSVADRDLVVALEGGRPGAWKVFYRAVSSVDGHQTRGTLTFKVSGKRDCGRGDVEPDDEIAAGGNPGIVDNPNPPDEGGTSWLWWVAGGTVAIAAVAFLIRRISQ